MPTSRSANSRDNAHFFSVRLPEVFELVFLKDGDIELSHGSKADVRIGSDSQAFMSLFQNPSAELFKDLESRNMIRITALTPKGKDTEAYIRHFLT